MRAAVIDHYGKNNNLKMKDIPRPTIKEYELLVEVAAASVNPIDIKLLGGNLKLVMPLKFPAVLGSDFAGTVIDAGNKVRKFKLGDRVFGKPRKTCAGTFAEYVAVSEEDIAFAPANISLIETASLPLVSLTAWQALNSIGMLKSGQKIFIPGGAGGVGAIAIQLAKIIGAFVATTTSTKNIEFVKSLGADQVLDYSKTHFEEVLSDFDLVLDTLGGKNLLAAFKILKEGGTLVSIAGVPDARLAREFERPFWVGLLLDIVSSKIRREAWNRKVKYTYLFMRPSGDQLQEISNLVDSGGIKTHIDKIFPLEQVADALKYVESGRMRGKVVIEIK